MSSGGMRSLEERLYSSKKVSQGVQCLSVSIAQLNLTLDELRGAKVLEDEQGL